MTLDDRHINWDAAWQASLRYQRAAAFVSMGLGTTMSMVGLASGALIYGLSRNLPLAGLAALSSVVVGFIVSRRGRKALMGEPWVIEGTLQHKGEQPRPKGKGSRPVLVVDVTRARRLDPDGDLVEMPDSLGPRTLPARPGPWASAQPGQPAAFLCLPTGEVIAAMGEFRLEAPGA